MATPTLSPALRLFCCQNKFKKLIKKLLTVHNIFDTMKLQKQGRYINMLKVYLFKGSMLITAPTREDLITVESILDSLSASYVYDTEEDLSFRVYTLSYTILYKLIENYDLEVL